MDRFTEIKRQLDLKIPIIQIAKNEKCTERTVRLIRDGRVTSSEQRAQASAPLWTTMVCWDEILKDVLDGHPFRFVWSDVAKEKVGYKAFLDQFHKKYPLYKKSFVVHRFFEPGERCEVDYAGDKLSWIDGETGEIFEVVVFIGILGFSQKIYAEATVDQKGDNFVRSHVRMYKFYGGVPRITVPDCLKQGVARCHRYDPEINRSYRAMAQDLGTVIVPARPRKPKDKALVEGAVKLVMRLFRWKYRRHTFLSLKEINEALLTCCHEINNREHTRFKTSREHAFNEREAGALGRLLAGEYEVAEFKTVSIYDDSYVRFENTHYSAPHPYRGERVELKASDKTIELYLNSERIALHRRSRRAMGEYITDPSHLPDNARAYHEATPQNLLSQARFLSAPLAELIEGLFKENVCAHLRRVQGLIRVSRTEIEKVGIDRARAGIAPAVEDMRRFDRIRVPYYEDLLAKYRADASKSKTADKMKIDRRANPNLRHTAKGAASQSWWKLASG
ncbi:MAG: IS21 family transposase [Bdellovibrionaceae bacterium]|nr:IS21 family transposase [Pseudobdellovibrionaceae bacterium]